MAHKLHIRVQDSLLDTRYLYVADFSDYDPILPIDNHTLMVQLPGYETPLELIFTLRGQNAYNQKSFGQVQTRAELCAINDGLYAFTYSVNPNRQVYTMVYHYRTVLIETQIYNAFLQSRLLQDDFNTKAFTENINKLIMAEKMLAGLKRNLHHSIDMAAVNREYNEIVKLVESVEFKISC